MSLTPKEKRDLISVAKRALTYSGIVVLILAILIGVYYMGIRYQRARCINKTGANVSQEPPIVSGVIHHQNPCTMPSGRIESMHQDKSKTK